MMKFLLAIMAINLIRFNFATASVIDAIDDDTPVELEEIAGDKNLTGTRPWRMPDYSNQKYALGWSEHAFDVPKGLETNVKFWLDIYTKYTTDQGLLHDADHIDLIYQIIDFKALTAGKDLTERQKNKLKSKAVKEAKKRIIAMLTKLQKIKEPSALNEEERKVWDYFQNVEGKNKFIEASKRNRLRLQLGQRDRIIQGIFFSGRYLEDFEKIFIDAGLPKELTRLVFVESSFNVLARSKVGASGLWQIMRYTGRPYMMINSTIDKRNSPIEATKLAAKLMKINFNMLGSWPLAITGYNHGPAGVLRLTKYNKSRELSDLAENKNPRKRLGFASKNFYPSFLAILEAEKNAPKYYGMVYWSKPLVGVDIVLDRPITWSYILKWFDGNDQVAQIYNPHITSMARKFGRPLPRKAVISVPAAKKDIALAEISQIKEGDINSTKSRITYHDGVQTYKVRRGDTIIGIAKDFGCSTKELMALNNLRSPMQLRAGRVLRIP